MSSRVFRCLPILSVYPASHLFVLPNNVLSSNGILGRLCRSLSSIADAGKEGVSPASLRIPSVQVGVAKLQAVRSRSLYVRSRSSEG
jgi:hypothetical protein